MPTATPFRRGAQIAAVALALTATLTAQPTPRLPAPKSTSTPTPSAPSLRAMQAIRQSDLKRDLFEMASPAMRGREGGTIDELSASMWVAEQYRRIGLTPMGENGTYFQWFNIVRTRVSTAASSATIGTRVMTLFTDIIPLNVVPIEAAGQVRWLADATDTTVDVRGRIVATPLVTPAANTVRSTSYPTRVRYAEAAIVATMRSLVRRGAAAMLLVASAPVDSAFEAMAVMRIRGAYDVDRATPRGFGQSDRVAPPPVAGVGPAPTFLVRADMATLLRTEPTAAFSIRLERFDAPSVNVIAGLRGTDATLRNEYVLFSSHQDANGVRALEPGDSVLAGADDNGSVSVAQFAAARAFVAQRSRRSVLFVHHGAEERGLLGSRYHSAHPMVPISQIVAVLNGDMIGRNHPDTAALLGVQPPHRSSSELVQLALVANTKTGRFVVDTLWDRPSHPEGWYFRSDHVPYARLGVPSLMYTTNLHSDYHTATDTPERIDYPKLLRMTQWMYLTGWYAANVSKRPAPDAGFKLER